LGGLKRAQALREGFYECVKLFEGINQGEIKEEVLFKVHTIIARGHRIQEARCCTGVQTPR
jgi:hypothetical protein